MAEQLKLHQRWEFRRKDNDSDSSNDSKPSGEPALKTYKLISSFISVDNEETSEATKLHQNGNCDPGISDQMKSGKAENGRRRRKSKRDDSAPNEIKKGPRKGVRRKTITDEQAVFYDLKKYMNFLLEDLKVSRENLLKWTREEMQKLVAEETVSELETRERSFRGEKVQLQNQTNFEENAEVQDQNIFKKNIPAQHQNNIQGYGQLQAHKEFEENVHRQNLVNFENTEVHHQETIFLHNRNAFKSFKGAQDCNDESTESKYDGCTIESSSSSLFILLQQESKRTKSEEKLKKIAVLTRPSGEEIDDPVCKGCPQIIHGSACACQSGCDFWLHISCFESPTELVLPLHLLHHPLSLDFKDSYENFICSECRDLSNNFSFHCNLCEFQLDVRCASIIDGIKVQRPERSKIEIGIYYFSDPHELIYFNKRDILTQN
ncbi:hypothetical protein NC653_009083 [Populus alba x Populus x berolinensis]|uniref:DC1 domain-containing protein n=2 Tax=Populus TaxID=3689 RepID=A0A4U5PUA2_POPAL|nr:hypothetical protein NC653_009083 [Populus alba x Populus x berolinensis]TKS01013.1 hypothetical protein D5086_0000174960 [Populus alba]